ncbi:MAG: hypothetical protein ACKV19_29590 [Verrucomicrobiales bacterium]
MSSKALAPRSLHSFLADMDVTHVTGWRWRQKGILETIDINGRLYVTPEAMERFLARARAGEFARGARGAAKSKKKPAASA